MKTIIILTLSLIFFNIAIATAEKGYYITFENDTVYVDFVGAYSGSTAKPKHYTWSAVYLDEDRNKTLLSPKTAKEIFWISDLGDTNRMVSILNKAMYPSPPDKNGQRFFATVVIENKKLNLYIFHTYKGPFYFRSSGEVSRYVFVKENGDMLDTGYFGDRKRIIKFLADCPEVGRSIKDKRIKTYEEVIDLYNSICGVDIENNAHQ